MGSSLQLADCVGENTDGMEPGDQPLDSAGVTRIPAALGALRASELDLRASNWVVGLISQVLADNSVMTGFRLHNNGSSSGRAAVSLHNFHAKVRAKQQRQDAYCWHAEISLSDGLRGKDLIADDTGV